MSVAANPHDLREVEAFYKRWGPDVFVFCRLFLGNESQAETACSTAFLEFYRESSELPTTGEIPARLVGLAYQAMRPCRASPALEAKDGVLESRIVCLERKQRAVFIMRNVLGMGWDATARATELSVEEVRQHWVTGMLRVRELLPREFFEDHH